MKGSHTWVPSRPSTGYLASLALAFWAVCAQAQEVDRFYAPQGCTEELTVQGRGCHVVNVWRCAADAAGESWAMTLEQAGPTYLSKTDAQGQWLESYEFFPTSRDLLEQPSADPMHLDELIGTGRDSFDVTVQGPLGAFRYVGKEWLTGDEVVIDGEPLKQTAFAAEAFVDGVKSYAVTGREYVSVRHRRFFGGEDSLSDTQGTVQRNFTPVEFIYPGEPGFFARTPKYDCAAGLAGFVPEQGAGQ